MRTNVRLWLGLASALACMAGDCGGGSGSSGGASVAFRSAAPNCRVLGSAFPPGFDFVAGDPGRMIVAEFEPPTLVRLDIRSDRPVEIGKLELPADSDGDGREEGSGLVAFSPKIDGVFANSPVLDAAGIALSTASGYEEVIFVRSDLSGLADVDIFVPSGSPGFMLSDNPFLPMPGTQGRRTGLSTLQCIRPPAGARDSRGALLSDVLDPRFTCDSGSVSYYSRFTSGVAVTPETSGMGAGTTPAKLFVSMSNLDDGAGTANPQFLPGSVGIYPFDPATTPPRIDLEAGASFVTTTAFNPSEVTAHTTPGGREFVLVSLSGSVGIVRDDPNTPAVESGTLVLSPSAIDVLDPTSDQIVATYPLGDAGLSFDRLAIHPSGRVAVGGSSNSRSLYIVDLAPLEMLPSVVGTPLRLDGSSGPDAVIFDAADPLAMPHRVGGAPLDRCPGNTVGAAFSADGTRLYATDFCDGTIGIFRVALPASFSDPVSQSHFRFDRLEAVVAPIRDDTLGADRGLASIGVRPGIPGTDFDGPDLFFTVDQSEGLSCSFRERASAL